MELFPPTELQSLDRALQTNGWDLSHFDVVGDRQWATFWEVQSERKRLHYAARDWLSDRLPGFFAKSSEPLPLRDLMVFDKLGPTADVPELASAENAREKEIQRGDALRALGLNEPAFKMLQSAGRCGGIRGRLFEVLR